MTQSAESDPYGALNEQLGVTVPRDVLELALTHRSFANEHGGLPNNERLEFLGDAVLEMVVTDTLYRRYPDRPEGELAKIRASVVNARACADAARAIGLGPHLQLGKGEAATGGHEKTSILADAMEAVLGAVYIGCGLPHAAQLVDRLFGRRMVEAAELGVGLDWKTSLQEFTARHGLGVPEYVVTAEGPDHARRFSARVRISAGSFGQGAGKTKKDAEIQAARTAYQALAQRHGAGGA